MQTLDSFSLRLSRALDALRQGKSVLVMDDFDRENEADLIAAAQTMSHAAMVQMIRDGSGIVCLCLQQDVLDHLQLPLMVEQNQSKYSTAFTVTIEAREGVTTGVSAIDRLTTIRTAVADNAQAQDLARPGHVFPLRAHAQGLQGRRGHTECSVELARLAGLKPAGVLTELMHPDGTMMRMEGAIQYSKQHGLEILTVAEVAQWLAEQTD